MRNDDLLINEDRAGLIYIRCCAASARPWWYRWPDNPLSDGPYAREGIVEGPKGVPIPDSGADEPYDSEFIANSRQDVPDLLKDWWTMRRELLLARDALWIAYKCWKDGIGVETGMNDAKEAEESISKLLGTSSRFASNGPFKVSP